MGHDDETSDLRGDRIATLEQTIRKRIHYVADEVQTLVTWKAEHMMESKLRGEAIVATLNDVNAHLSAQDKAFAGLTKQVTFWAGGLAALFAAFGIVVAVVELWPKR